MTSVIDGGYTIDGFSVAAGADHWFTNFVLGVLAGVYYKTDYG